MTTAPEACRIPPSGCPHRLTAGLVRAALLEITLTPVAVGADRHLSSVPKGRSPLLLSPTGASRSERSAILVIL